MAFKTFFCGEVDIHDELLTNLIYGLTGKNARSAQFNSYKQNMKKLTIKYSWPVQSPQNNKTKSISGRNPEGIHGFHGNPPGSHRPKIFACYINVGIIVIVSQWKTLFEKSRCALQSTSLLVTIILSATPPLCA